MATLQKKVSQSEKAKKESIAGDILYLFLQVNLQTKKYIVYRHVNLQGTYYF